MYIWLSSCQYNSTKLLCRRLPESNPADQRSNLCLCKGWISPYKLQVQQELRTFPKEECSKHVQACNLDYDDLPTERALGIQWCAETDTFRFSINLRAKPIMRRGMSSTISSIYDPLGFLALLILPAKKLLQEFCRNANLGWDDELSIEHQIEWMKWLN